MTLSEEQKTHRRRLVPRRSRTASGINEQRVGQAAGEVAQQPDATVLKASVKVQQRSQQFASVSSFLLLWAISSPSAKTIGGGMEMQKFWSLLVNFKRGKKQKGRFCTVSLPCKQELHIEAEMSSFAWNSCRYNSSHPCTHTREGSCFYHCGV